MAGSAKLSLTVDFHFSADYDPQTIAIVIGVLTEATENWGGTVVTGSIEGHEIDIQAIVEAK